MDLTYEYLQQDPVVKKESEPGAKDTPEDGSKPEQPQPTLNDEIQDAYKAFSASPWGARIGGFLGNVVKQSESVYTQASKEFAEVKEDATKGFHDLRESVVTQSRGLTLHDVLEVSKVEPMEGESSDTRAKGPATEGSTEESESMLSRLRAEAAKRLKDLKLAEDAADEALLRFGGNVRNFLRDAITVAPPDETTQGNTVLFESKDAKGKRVIHTSRFDAQLHVIHTSTEGFIKDPSSAEYEQWSKDFDVDKKTEDISTDLAKYPDLRATMEKLVPDQIPYADFWKRYYYLRHGIETAETRRRDLLKAAAEEDEVGWGDDSDDDETADAKPEAPQKPASVTSSTTIQPAATEGTLKPVESRKSNDERSQADSEASYDVVGAASGMTSQAPSSPKDSKKADDSDDDWE
ncbi:BSD domain-containing protein C22A12.14c-like protein [Hapsidospora chrysogenum ATCC 11550]|uniref:BSD domain-containing protein C22A12.14c-like protein n=1 Tax=Hapsidospora chrysogenum (strain ATCC 11550 / CBS 779.69 / DSM 880 / IAM 14645 / JCM 23072 / IMI 49137) TaxID=857340 RepID=A0A086TAI0_HAPC1|nr:BSD domain-containing protein C22A12.14c-like protein [Hapsidospora chrysogenum ATCC 11550]